MIRLSRNIAFVSVATVLALSGVRAQIPSLEPAPSKSAPAQPQRDATPLRLTVVISRFLADKKTGSLPYVISVNDDGVKSNLRMGMDVAVPQSVIGNSGTSMSFSYKPVSTSIDCVAEPTKDGRYRVNVTVQDSSVSDPQKAGVGMTGIPAYQSFSSNTVLIMRDAQTIQYTSATDKVTGEVIKIDVTLNVVK